VDLRSLVLRRLVPRVFVVTGAGGRRARLATERIVRTRGWRVALSPAEANVLVLCAPQHHDLDEVVDRLWDQLPSPRARTQVVAADEAEARLGAAAAALTDLTHQRLDAATRAAGAAAAGMARHEPAGHDMAGHGGHEAHGGHDMTEHGGHEVHGGHDMGGMPVAGVRMARRGEDRDGLKLDQLHLSLGPAMPDWPAGLVVRLTVQGDVVQRALVELRVHGSHGAAPAPRGPTEQLDSLQRLLSVAGWPAAAVEARRLRDEWAGGPPGEAVRRDYQRWSRRVRRSRLLRWSTDSVGVLGAGVPDALRGDATARWTRWLDGVDTGLISSAEQDAQGALDALPGLLVGQELAAARLIVASLDPDVEALATSRSPEPARG
jgi:hypothetical protein